MLITNILCILFIDFSPLRTCFIINHNIGNDPNLIIFFYKIWLTYFYHDYLIK